MRKIKIITFIICCFFVGKVISQDYYNKAFKIYSKDSLSDNDVNNAIKLFDLAIDAKQKIAESFLYRAACRSINKQFFEALSDIRKSIELDSSNFKAYYIYGRIYFEQGFYYNAIKFYNKGLKINKFDAVLYDERALCYSLIGDYENALRDYDMVIKLDKKNERCYVNRGQLFQLLKNYTRAIQDFDEAISLSKNPIAYANKGVALANLGQNEKAIEYFFIAIDKLPAAGDLLYERAMSYLALNRKELACLDLKKSIELGYKKAESTLNEICKGKSN
ncbi:MAG: tetratricopeptide repeat protein [Bacteroidia bacterium]|nr:tetratricopeptide repeat protein [Bacteroidia bacterium]